MFLKAQDDVHNPKITFLLAVTSYKARKKKKKITFNKLESENFNFFFLEMTLLINLKTDGMIAGSKLTLISFVTIETTQFIQLKHLRWGEDVFNRTKLCMCSLSCVIFVHDLFVML